MHLLLFFLLTFPKCMLLLLWQEEVEVEAKVVGDKGRITSVLVEVRRKSNGELIALGKQWMASHNNSNKASKLWVYTIYLRWGETSVCIEPFCNNWHEFHQVYSWSFSSLKFPIAVLHRFIYIYIYDQKTLFQFFLVPSLCYIWGSLCNVTRKIISILHFVYDEWLILTIRNDIMVAVGPASSSSRQLPIQILCFISTQNCLIKSTLSRSWRFTTTLVRTIGLITIQSKTLQEQTWEFNWFVIHGLQQSPNLDVLIPYLYTLICTNLYVAIWIPLYFKARPWDIRDSFPS